MTEAQWHVSEDPSMMLRYVLASQRPSDRKLRLIAAAIERAYLRVVIEAHTDETPDVLHAEAMADGARRTRGSHWILSHEAEHAARESVHIHDLPRQLPLNCAILREIVGNPFTPVMVAPAWRTAEVLRLASGAYDARRYDELPIIADALQDANCDSAELLDHLQGSGPHLLGCWALDLILGKQ